MMRIELIVALLFVVVLLAIAARRIGTPLPILLVIGGVILGVVGKAIHVSAPISMPADLVLAVVLPPLLVSASFEVPLRAFRANLRPITLLAVGLVLVTMTCVAFATHYFVPAVPLAAAFVLGAILAPPDPVAATAIAQRLGLPNRITTIIEGEGLVNDATALVAYNLAVAAVVTGTFSWWGASLDFLRSGPTGVAVGLLAGWLATLMLRRIDDNVLETMISLLLPYVAYLGAEQAHGSGVLADVTLGFILRRRYTDMHSASTRLAMRRIWDMLVFLINGVVFILIGMQLGTLASSVLSPRIMSAVGLLSLLLIVTRIAWMFAVPATIRLLSGGRSSNLAIPPRELLVLGWAGMRGVVSLAVALAIPFRTAQGDPFPARAVIVLVTFGVLFITLVLQGLTLAPLARWLGVVDPDAAERQERTVRERAQSASLEAVNTMVAERTLSGSCAGRLRESLRDESGVATGTAEPEELVRGRFAALDRQREVVLRARDDGDISDAISRRLEEELDVESVHLRDVMERSKTQD